MTQEGKELLVKDLCSRIPYNTICQFNDNARIIDSVPQPIYDSILTEHSFGLFRNHVGFSIKPYLRPMSSMTKEECEELGAIDSLMDNVGEEIPDLPYHIEIASHKQIEWLNVHHFDYRHLIENGLAIEAPENMYND